MKVPLAKKPGYAAANEPGAVFLPVPISYRRGRSAHYKGQKSRYSAIRDIVPNSRNFPNV